MYGLVTGSQTASATAAAASGAKRLAAAAIRPAAATATAVSTGTMISQKVEVRRSPSGYLRAALATMTVTSITGNMAASANRWSQISAAMPASAPAVPTAR